VWRFMGVARKSPSLITTRPILVAMTTHTSEQSHERVLGDPPDGSESFGDRVLAFYRTLVRPQVSARPVEWIDPYHSPEVRRAMDAFYGTFYSDDRPRLFVFGINPGRFGAGLTGIPFTDRYALAHSCGIPTSLPQRQELSATFIHRVIQKWGGATPFFGGVYITAVCPLGLLSRGVNFNYYDDRAVLSELEPFLLVCIRRQIDFGARRQAAVVVGSGQNFRVLQRLNAEHGFFEELRAVEHPRFIMQYRRTEVDQYVSRYLRLFEELLR